MALDPAVRLTLMDALRRPRPRSPTSSRARRSRCGSRAASRSSSWSAQAPMPHAARARPRPPSRRRARARGVEDDDTVARITLRLPESLKARPRSWPPGAVSRSTPGWSTAARDRAARSTSTSTCRASRSSTGTARPQPHSKRIRVGLTQHHPRQPRNRPARAGSGAEHDPPATGGTPCSDLHTPEPVALHVELGSATSSSWRRDTDRRPSVDVTRARRPTTTSAVEQRGDDVVVIGLPEPARLLRLPSGELPVHVTVPTGSSARAPSSARPTSGPRASSATSAQVRLRRGPRRRARRRRHVRDRLRRHLGRLRRRRAPDSSPAPATSASAPSTRPGRDHDRLRRRRHRAAGGAVKVKSGSGDIVVSEAGDGVDAMAGSGDLRGRPHRPRQAQRQDRLGRHHGRRGRRVRRLDLDITAVTGDVRSDLDGAGAARRGPGLVELRSQTVSGDVVLQRL